MSIQDTDKFLVNRDGSSYHLEAQNLMAELQDDDLMLVNRAGKSYKTTGAEIKASLKPPAPPFIRSVDLVEQDPDNEFRFTDQEFTATVEMALQGDPISTKTLDAYVEGTFKNTLRSTNPITEVVDVDVEWEYCPIDGVENDAVSGYGIAEASPDGVVIVAQHSSSADIKIFRSTDGLNFTAVSGVPTFNSTFVGNIVYAQGKFVINGKNPARDKACFLVSEDGLSWEYKEVSGIPIPANQRVWKTGTDGQRIVFSIETATNTTKTVLYYTDDLQTFETCTFDDEITWRANSIAYGDGVWMTVDAKQKKAWRSTNGGSEWTVMNFPSIVTGKYAFNVEYNNGRWWLHTNDADFDFISDDGGDTWTEITQNKSFRGQVDTLSVQGLFIGCSVGFTDPYYNTGFYATSSDGIYWEDGDPDQTVFTTRSNTSCYSDVHKKFYVAGTGFVVRSTVPGPAKGLTIAGAETDGFLPAETVTSDPAGGGVSTIIDLDDTFVLVTEGGTWEAGQHLLGRDMFRDGVKKYLQFDNDGNVTDLLDSPQQPAWSTQDLEPTLTFKFPSTFDSGEVPDDLLQEGTNLTVCATASNESGSDGPICGTVTPEADDPDPDAVIIAKPGYIVGVFSDGSYYTIDDTRKYVNVISADEAILAIGEDNVLYYNYVSGSSWAGPQVVSALSPDGNPWEGIAGDWDKSYTDAIARDSAGYVYALSGYDYRGDPNPPTVGERIATGIANIGNCGTYAYTLWMQEYGDTPRIKFYEQYNGVQSFYFAELDILENSKIKQVLAYRGASGGTNQNQYNSFVILMATGDVYVVGDLPSQFQAPSGGTISNPVLWDLSAYTDEKISSVNSPSTIWSEQDICFRTRSGELILANTTQRNDRYEAFNLKHYRPGQKFLSLPIGSWLNKWMFIEMDGRVYVDSSANCSGQSQNLAFTDPELGSQGGIQFGLTKAFNETSSGKVPGAEMGIVLTPEVKARTISEASGAIWNLLQSGTSAALTAARAELGLPEPLEAPQAIDGYYPLYTTEADANAAGDGTSHTHTFDGVTYYMPNGVPYHHGDYE